MRIEREFEFEFEFEFVEKILFFFPASYKLIPNSFFYCGFTIVRGSKIFTRG